MRERHARHESFSEPGGYAMVFHVHVQQCMMDMMCVLSGGIGFQCSLSLRTPFSPAPAPPRPASGPGSPQAPQQPAKMMTTPRHLALERHFLPVCDCGQFKANLGSFGRRWSHLLNKVYHEMKVPLQPTPPHILTSTTASKRH